MFRKISVLVIFTALFSVTVCPVTVFGYKGSVHKRIATTALGKSKTGAFLGTIGFENGIKHEIKGNFDEPKTVAEWVEYGSEWEDWVLVCHYGINSPEGIIYGHFYNPLTNNGLTDKQGNILGQSLVERATDSSNEWSYQMAKELFYAALTGNNTGINFWRMRDHKLGAGVIEKKRDMSEKEREEFFAWTFQSLGHTLHLLADASVPAHTRNDGHSGRFIPFLIWDPEPYESWTDDNPEKLKDYYNGDGSAPWTGWQDHSEIQVPDVFIDTERLNAGTSEPFTDLDQGLAEYSHANFLSKDTVFDSGLPSTLSGLHELAYPPYEKLGDSVFIEDKYEKLGDSVFIAVKRFVYVASRHAGGPEHFARCGILWHIKNSVFFPDYTPALPDYTPLTAILYTVDDDLVNKDYAEKLIPRAVGYSAGLLDYFFRGRLEISLPETGAYSVISDPDSLDNPSAQGFETIRVCVKNVSAEGEDMSGGKLTAVVKYRLSRGNPFQNPPALTSDEFYYVTGETGDNLAVPRDSPATFEISLNGPVPLWSTDVYIYLVYRGKLGTEADGVAVGFKDISEPTPLWLFNATDKICLFGDIRLGVGRCAERA
jgi:hypothetical protein